VRDEASSQGHRPNRGDHLVSPEACCALRRAGKQPSRSTGRGSSTTTTSFTSSQIHQPFVRLRVELLEDLRTASPYVLAAPG
jgi:hypothetical protein